MRQTTQRLGPGVQVDWHTMMVTNMDGRHGVVVDTRIFLDPNELRTGLHVMVAWANGSGTLYTVLNGGAQMIEQDAPMHDPRRVH